MSIKFSFSRQMDFFDHTLIVLLLVFVIGCSGHNMPASQSQSKSIESFNEGRDIEAVTWAKKLAGVNSSESDFLLTQYIIYDAVEYNTDLYRINKKWYRSVVAADLSKVDPALRDRYIAAQVFSEIYLNSSNGAMSLLSESCKTWIAADAGPCMDQIISNIQASYVSKPSRIGALYLIEAVEAWHTLKLIDQKSYHYNSGIAFAAIDKRRSLVTLRYLMGNDQLNNYMKKTYCSILNMDFYDSTGQSQLGQMANLKEFKISAACPIVKGGAMK